MVHTGKEVFTEEAASKLVLDVQDGANREGRSKGISRQGNSMSTDTQAEQCQTSHTIWLELKVKRKHSYKRKKTKQNKKTKRMYRGTKRSSNLPKITQLIVSI